MRVKKFFRWIILLLLAGTVLGAAALGGIYYLYGRDLPDVEELRDVQLEVPLRVLTREGQLMGVFGERRRVPVSFEDIPECITQAFLAGEDARFFEHPGVDYQGISRAVIHLVRTGNKSVGGSTITQQLARNFYLGFEKTYVRKIKEIFLALKIERELSKNEILELYLNKIFLGHRAYGIGAAAQVYYGKTVDQLSIAQCAMIAALPKAPSRINPISSPERALERRDYVIERMRELSYISDEVANSALAERDQAFNHGPKVEVHAPYVAEMVRAEIVEQLGTEAYNSGLSVTTTLSGPLQQAARDALRRGLIAYDRRHGYRGAEAQVALPQNADSSAWEEALVGYQPLAGLQPGLVIEVSDELAMIYLVDGQTVALSLEQVAWARPFLETDSRGPAPETVAEVLKRGDIVRLALDDEGAWQLSQLPNVEGALVSLDPSDGAVRALIGGFDFQVSKYNRAIQSRRQPGSSFKPFVYSAAIEQGYTTATLVNDAPVVYQDPSLEKAWKPQNFSEQIYGPTRLREAMVASRNLVSIRLLEDIGIDFARDYIAGFGFDREQLPPSLSMALGSASLTPLQMAGGYAVFANGGHRVTPYYIDSIRDRDGQLVMGAQPAVICDECPDYSENNFIEPVAGDTPRLAPLPIGGQPEAGEETLPMGPPLPNIAPRVITEQNAYLVRSMMMDVVRRGTGRRAMELGRNDLAGKTGTTNDQRDAWFNGYNSSVVTTVWVGFDDYRPLGRGELGGSAALPVWIDYMRVALEGVPDQSPPMPNGLVQVRIDPDSGLLSPPGSASGVLEVFRQDQVPDSSALPAVVSDQEGEEEDPFELF